MRRAYATGARRRDSHRDETARRLQLCRTRLRHFEQRRRADVVPLLRCLERECRRAKLRFRRVQLLYRRLIVEIRATHLEPDLLLTVLELESRILFIDLRALRREVRRTTVKQWNRQPEPQRTASALIQLIVERDVRRAVVGRVVAGRHRKRWPPAALRRPHALSGRAHQ